MLISVFGVACERLNTVSAGHFHYISFHCLASNVQFIYVNTSLDKFDVQRRTQRQHKSC
jgi:hypothetical protein